MKKSNCCEPHTHVLLFVNQNKSWINFINLKIYEDHKNDQNDNNDQNSNLRFKKI